MKSSDNLISPINQFIGLLNNNLTTINKIEWWLLKFAQTYKEIVNFSKSNYFTITLEDGSVVKLPPLEESNHNKKFLGLYQALETISEFHRDEEYFKKELINYYQVKNSAIDLKNWVLKNEKLGAVKYVCFLIDYLNYSKNTEHLKVYVYTIKEIEIYIHRKDFENIIKFIEIFDKLYWKQKNLPDSIKKHK